MGKITEKQLKEWESKYEVFELPVGDKLGYLRSPNMTDYKLAFVAMQKHGEIAFGEALLNALWLGGDEEIKTNDEYFLPARKELMEFFEFTDATTKRLPSGNYEIVIVTPDGEERCEIRPITRNDLKMAEKRNPAGKPFVTQDKLFEFVCVSKSKGFENKNNPDVKFPLYQAIEKLQNQKVAALKKRSPRRS